MYLNNAYESFPKRKPANSFLKPSYMQYLAIFPRVASDLILNTLCFAFHRVYHCMIECQGRMSRQNAKAECQGKMPGMGIISTREIQSEIFFGVS